MKRDSLAEKLSKRRSESNQHFEPQRFEPLCSIIIPVFNLVSYTKDCLEFILRNTKYPNYEVLFVDNGSSDGTAEYLSSVSEKYEHVKTISLNENKGYTYANNIAAYEAKGDYLVLLNNDTAPLENWLSKLVEVAKDPSVSIVGSRLLYPDTHNVNHVGYVYSSNISCFYPIYHDVSHDFPPVLKQREYQALLGACLLVNKKDYFAVGMLGHYGLEDIDLCLKVRELGKKVVYCPSSQVYHHGSSTFKHVPDEEVPQMNSNEFNIRWPVEQRLSDDLHYYELDGFECSWSAGGELLISSKESRALEKSGKAVHALEAGDLYEAKRLLEEAYIYDPQCKNIMFALASLRKECGDYHGALDLADAARKRDPRFFAAHFFCNYLETRLGKLQDANRSLQYIFNISNVPFTVVSKAKELLSKLPLERSVGSIETDSVGTRTQEPVPNTTGKFTVN